MCITRALMIIGMATAVSFQHRSLNAAEARTPDGDPRDEDVIDVSPVWSGHPVGFHLLTHGRIQYVAFYDDQRHMTIGKRRVDQPEWEFVRLPSKLGWDSHNDITMALDRDEVLHVSGNMHGSRLIYFRSEKPADIATLRRVERMVGEAEGRVTYPRFIRGPDDQLIYMYRDGGSGNGRRFFNVYDEDTRSWSRLIDRPLLDGQGKMNAYPVGPVRGPDGMYHMCWVWRDTPDAATNHDLSYARSPDLAQWETSAGRKIELPMTIETCEIVDPVPAGKGLLNANLGLSFDHQDRPIIAYHKNDARGHTQVFNARLEEGNWRIRQASDWEYQWAFGGFGTIPMEIRIQAVRLETDGRLTQGYSHVKHGSGRWILDPDTLEPIGKAPTVHELPRDIRKVTSPIKGMRVRTCRDSGENHEPGVRYVLRWETLGPNRDRPHEGEPPPPSMLRLYRLSNTPH